ncbi:MAG: hypothetical protein HY526_00190 [Betaproteobacteria bacterium]|nr:hypothetical protein [Betaproteobacteria bacterium]
MTPAEYIPRLHGYRDNKFPLTRPDDLSLRLYGAGGLKPTWVKHTAAPGAAHEAAPAHPERRPATR